jgi:hypothetical protein
MCYQFACGELGAVWVNAHSDHCTAGWITGKSNVVLNGFRRFDGGYVCWIVSDRGHIGFLLHRADRWNELIRVPIRQMALFACYVEGAALVEHAVHVALFDGA